MRARDRLQGVPGKTDGHALPCQCCNLVPEHPAYRLACALTTKEDGTSPAFIGGTGGYHGLDRIYIEIRSYVGGLSLLMCCICNFIKGQKSPKDFIATATLMNNHSTQWPV